jgi:multiple sugar transport system ATP-binding protein
VARVPAESRATVGESLELALDTTKLAVFDGDSGVNLTIAPADTE